MLNTVENSIKAVVCEAVRETLAEQQPVVLEESPTITVKQAAAILGVSVPTMYNISHRDDFDACIAVGRKRIILRHKLFAWMERQTEKVNM